VKSRVFAVLITVLTGMFGLAPRNAAALEVLCDPALENCRTRLLDLIRAEQVGIDVAFWFMEDPRYTTELIKRHQAGVRIRVLVDPRGSGTNPLNADRLNELQAAGVPMRYRSAPGILHWKMMLFDGQNTVQFSAGNYSEWAFVPVEPYVNYVDEMIYFTDQASVVNSFRTKYDDLWTNTTQYSNYANISGPLLRYHPTYPKDPELNFPPTENYRTRIVKLYDLETVGIDVTMYRVTDRAHADAMIRAVQRGVPVRFYTEPQQYRDPVRLWHSWNVDRMYMAGVQIRDRAHAGLNHQKSVTLRSQAMTVWGSSNWTSQSADGQEEHNYFTTKPNFYFWFSDQFERKWNNTIGVAETKPFTPLPPDAPAILAPANGATNQSTTSLTLTWHAGYWAHVYDIYFGTTPDPPLYAEALALGPSQTATDYKRYTVTNLVPGTTYYWRVVSKTAASLSASGPTFTFTTTGTAPPPTPSQPLGPGDILLYASRATKFGGWRVFADPTAAGGNRIGIPNAGAAKVTTALAAPADYFELTFTADAGKAYRLWIRGMAENNYWANDSVHVQFSDSVTASGTAVYRTGTTGSAEVNLEDGAGAGVSGWGWQDNGYGVGVLGPLLYFATTGTHTIRVQKREDGFWIDQILLSPETYLSTAPGALENDTTIFQEHDGSGTPPPPPPPPPSDPAEIVLYASTATITGGAWTVIADPSAAGGSLIRNPDAGGAKINTALANPSSYFELTFDAIGGIPYRLWIRSRAQNDYWGNDSVHVQFSDSTDLNGAAVYRIGTTSAAWVNLEDCSGCGLSGWGWQDNGYGVMGPEIFFATSSTKTIRVQTREDGMSIDQIVLSYSTYLYQLPGLLKNDSTILPPSSGSTGGGDDDPPPPEEDAAPEIVLYASKGAPAGQWGRVTDASAAGGAAMAQPDAGAPKIAQAWPAPSDYFDLSFMARADVPYRLWIRARAESNHWSNDSAHFQFSGSVTQDGTPAFRIGTTESTVVVLEDCSGCGLSGWGWQDNGYGRGVLGPLVYFAESGQQTVRVQTREDGLRIDQLVLSPRQYLNAAPGALTNDTTILAENGS
jgi:phosphatidylserine/phosphatidylglycerophosphate/cardiolipin synthase-like enzyme